MDYKFYADDIRNAVSMPQLLEYYGFEVDRKGFMCCPFHNEKTPSFKAYSGKGGFHCFGCGEHGDVISFVMKYYNLNFIDAMKKLNEDFSVGLPIGQKIPKRRQVSIAKQAFERRKALKAQKDELDRLKANYEAALDEFARLDKQRMKYAPKGNEEPLHPKFVEAIKGIEAAKHKVSIAETEMWKYENRIRSNYNS